MLCKAVAAMSSTRATMLFTLRYMNFSLLPKLPYLCHSINACDFQSIRLKSHLWVFWNIGVALENRENCFVCYIWDLWDVGVIRKARRSVQISDGNVVGIVVVENIVQTLERSSKDIRGKVSYADNGED